jgi:PAS domain S-box-containing protein
MDREEERVLLTSVIEDISFAMHDFKLQSRLQSSEQRYKAIFENTGTAMVIDDEEMRTVMVNAEFTRLTGYSRSELENNMQWTGLIHKDDVDRFKSFRRTSVINPGTQKICEFRLIAKDGAIKEVFGFAHIIPETGNGAVSIIDLTDQKKMKEYLKNQIDAQKEILESMSGGIQGLGRPIKFK